MLVIAAIFAAYYIGKKGLVIEKMTLKELITRAVDKDVAPNELRPFTMSIFLIDDDGSIVSAWVDREYSDDLPHYAHDALDILLIKRSQIRKEHGLL